MSPPAKEAAVNDPSEPDAVPAHRREAGVLSDLTAAAVLAAISLGLGIFCNQWRARPLPWVYQTREQRLGSAVEKAAGEEGTGSPLAESANLPHEIRLDEFQPFVTERRGLVLDVRSPVFYAQGHVPGAVNLPREDFAEEYPRRRQTLEAFKDREIAVYCSGADCPDAELVAAALTKLGYRRLLIYTSGWDEWSQTGLPQEGAPPP